jgi:16S rRNA (adenine1518-N6/adenine1519-N6)-dimethyltransferase
MAFTLREVQEQLQALGVSPKKSLGQNFLINPHAIDRIIQAVERTNANGIIEVGPGLGALTAPLAELKKPIVLMELDREFSKLWREKGFEVIEDDALQTDWSRFTQTGPWTLVSNLPYQISSSLVIDRSIEPCGIEHMILMFQKEVAQRLVAKHGTENYGLLSVIAQNAWNVQKEFEISSKDFYPPPLVASQVVRFESLKSNLKRQFLTFVKAAFAHRRKFLIKNVSGLADFGVLEDVWDAQKLSRKARPEDLSPRRFRELFEGISARTATHEK